jgi:hypothetical protein
MFFVPNQDFYSSFKKRIDWRMIVVQEKQEQFF